MHRMHEEKGQSPVEEPQTFVHFSDGLFHISLISKERIIFLFQEQNSRLKQEGRKQLVP